MEFLIDNIGHIMPYLLLLTAYLILSFHAELTGKRIFALTSLTILILFAGLRQPFTPDMERYRSMFEAPSTLSPIFIEPSFIVISNALNEIGFDYHALFLLYTAITLIFVYFGIRNLTQHIRIALLLYVLIPACYLNLFVEMRQLSGIAIAFYATSLILRKNTRHRLLKVFVWAAVSVFFHYSSLFYWVILLCSYKLAQRSYRTVVYIAVMCISVAIPTSAVISGFAFLASPILPSKLQAYIDAFARSSVTLAESGQILKSAVYITIGIFFVLRVRRHERDLRLRILVNLFVIGVVILNLTSGYAVVSRLAYFFLVYQVVLFPEILGQVEQREWSLLAGYSLVLFYLAQFLWGLFFYSEEAQSYMFLHYQNALFLIFQ